jgi:O-antigen/teichoic acid export membrane protein
MSSLSQKVFSGVVWIIIQTATTKIISFSAQIVLAWILLPSDFGKISLTYTVTNIGLLLQNFGLKEVLISRGKSFYAYLPLARSLSLLTGIICVVATLLLGIGGSIVYHDWQIMSLVIIYSCAIPFNALSLVPSSKLSIDVRFKYISLIAILSLLLTQGLTIAFAMLNFGVYSFVIPPVIAALLNYGILHYVTRISIRFIFTLRRWWLLVSKSFWGFVHSVCQTLIFQSDYIVLGLVATQSIVGIYAMAYSLSVQVIGLFTGNIGPVLFPSLMKVGEKGEQTKLVFLKCTAFFAMIGMPFAIWQGASAAPLIKIFLSNKWLNSIHLVEILSIGMAFRIVSSIWEIPFKLRAAFKQQAYNSVISSLSFFFLLIPFSYFFKEKGTAIAVSLFYIISSPVLLYCSFKYYSISLRLILNIFFKYSILTTFAFVPMFYLSHFIQNNWFCLLLNGILGPIIYVALLYCFDYNELNELINRVQNIRKNK